MDLLPECNAGYYEKNYWDDRYSQEESFDWFVKYDVIRDLLSNSTKKSDVILNLGN